MPSRRYLFAATESSLRQDADESNFEHGTLVRLIAYDLPLAAAAREYAYPLDPIPRPSRELRDPIGSIGVSEVMALSDKDLLVLERSFVEERNSSPRRHATTVRVYRVTLEGSAELGGRMSLRGSPPVVPLKKTLVVDGAELAPRLGGRLRQLENFEVMSAGPRLPGGCSSLLFLSDDNFSAEQVTALVVLSSPAPGPTTTPAARIPATASRPRARWKRGIGRSRPPVWDSIFASAMSSERSSRVTGTSPARGGSFDPRARVSCRCGASLRRGRQTLSSKRIHLTVHGPDRPGICHAICRVLARHAVPVVVAVSSSSGPTAVVRDYLDAIRAGDTQAALEIAGEPKPEGRLEFLSADALADDWTVDAIVERHRTDDEVDVDVTISTEHDSEQGRFHLVDDDDGWTIEAPFVAVDLVAGDLDVVELGGVRTRAVGHRAPAGVPRRLRAVPQPG